MKNIILLFFVLAFTSCATFKANSLAENRQTLSKDNLKKFEGTFKLISKDTSERTLDESLINHYSFRKIALKKRIFEESECKLTFNLIDKNHIKVELVNDTTIIESRVVKFKGEEDYLIFKKKKAFRTLILYSGLHTIHTRIGLLENENLIVDSISSYLFFLLVLPLADHKREYYALEFERIE